MKILTENQRRMLREVERAETPVSPPADDQVREALVERLRDLSYRGRQMTGPEASAYADFLLPAVSALVDKAHVDGGWDLRLELGRAWDAGNCVGLDGWVGPDRGEEPDPEALSARRRDIDHLINARSAIRRTEGN